MDTPNYPNSRPVNPSQPPLPPSPWWHDRVKLFFVIAVGILAIAVTGLLLAVLNARGGEGAAASVTPTPSSPVASTEPSPSPSFAEPTDSAEPSSSPDPSPSPSASPDPPQAELKEGWARINTGLNLRNGASADAPIITRLQAGEVVWVGYSEPSREDIDDDRDWYQIETLKDKYGWIASGTPDDPFATTISNQFTFRSCGPVKALDHAATVNGLRTPRLDDAARASAELAQAMGTPACQRFSNEDYEPTVKLDLLATACGAPTWDGADTRLSPTTAGSVNAWRVQSTIVVPNALVTDRQQVDSDGLTNQQKFFILGSRLAEPFLCYSSELSFRTYSRQDNVAELADCLVITAKDDNFVTFDPANGDPVTFRRTNRSRDGINGIPIDDPALMQLTGNGGGLRVEAVGDC